MYVCECMHVGTVYAYECVSVHAHACARDTYLYMSRFDVDTTGLIWTQPNVLRQGLLLELVLTDWLDWLTSKAPEAGLSLPPA